MTLCKHRVKLVNNIEAKDLTDYLIQEGILITEDVEIIHSKTTRADRARTLLDIIPTQGPKAFEVFREALTENYKWLADELQVM